MGSQLKIHPEPPASGVTNSPRKFECLSRSRCWSSCRSVRLSASPSRSRLLSALFALKLSSCTSVSSASSRVRRSVASPISRLCEVIQTSALARWAPAPPHHASSGSSAPQLLCGLHELRSGGGGGVSGAHDALHSAQLLLQVPEAALKGTQHTRLLQFLGPLLQAPCAGRQILHHAVPVPKARVAGMAGGKDSREATGTLVAAHTRHARAAAAVARGTVTLRCIYPTRVTVTGCGQRTDHRVRVPVEHPGKHPPIYSGPSSPLTTALQPRVSPVELLALRTGPPAETSTAVALACELE